MGNLLKRFGEKYCKKQVCIENGETHLLNSVWSEPGKCIRKMCLPGGKILVHSCPEVKPQKGCEEIEGNVNDKFPDCCDHLVCWKVLDQDTGEDLKILDKNIEEYIKL